MTRHFPNMPWALIAAAALVSTSLGQEGADPYVEVLSYKIDQPRTLVAALEAEIRAASAQELSAIEGRLIRIVQSAQATSDAKNWACRQLRQAGSERSVAALAPLLADPDLATVARWALQSIPGDKVDEALRAALGKVEGDLKAGVICTIGSRGDVKAIPLLAPLAGDKNPVIAEAALYALGHVGGPEALQAIQDATVPESLKRYRAHAFLLCAEQAAETNPPDAATVYGVVFFQCEDAVVAVAAQRGWLATATGPDRVKLALKALAADNVKLRRSAAKVICELGDAELLTPVMSELSTLPVDVQTTILDLVDDKSALPGVLAAINSDEEAVRAAALEALGRLGDETVVPQLLSIAATSGLEQAKARNSLARLRGKEVDRMLVATAEEGEAAQRMEAIKALVARTAKMAMPALLKLAEDTDSNVRSEAIKAIPPLAGCQSLGKLLKLLTDTNSDQDRRGFEKAVVATCQRVPRDPDWAAEHVIEAMSDQPATVRCSLVRILGSISSAKALEAVRKALDDEDADVEDAAIRGLAAWPDAAPMADLLQIAKSAQSQTHKVLALRGVARMAGLPGRPAKQAADLLAEAMELAPRAEERKLVLSALAEINHTAAMHVALTYLADEELEVEAAAAVVKIAKMVQRKNADAAADAIRKILDTCKSPAARQLAESAMIIADNLVNIAPQGTATSPDDLDKDGSAGDDQAAIDGNDATYWDEENGKDLYRLVVTFQRPEPITAISILGYGHHSFAPKVFQILCDGKSVKSIDAAQYDNNFLIVPIGEQTASTVELEITGYYGQSPAVRELGIYRPAADN